jgi:hypothetical protein
MARVENEFREFVGGFADPLTRLAFLLTAGVAGDPAVLSADALARTRRHWRDAEAAPESQAIEALLSALPHHRPFHLHGHAGAEETDDSEYVLASAGAADRAAVNHDAFRRPVAGDVPPIDAAALGGVHGGPGDGAVDVAVDVDVLREAVWKAWQRLTPRQRVPLVFVDPTVASRRLAGLGVPESFGTSRRFDLIGSGALVQLRTTLATDPTLGVAFANLRDRQFADLLADTLREHGSSPARVIDPYPAVVRRAQRLGRRAAVAVATVLAVLATGFVVALQASQPTKATSAAASASASASSSPTLVQTGPSPTFTGSLSSQGPFAPVARPTGRPIMVVPWLPRGTAANDTVLLAHLKSYFTTVHQDAEAQTQVLLATDTPTMRIAYVTANSPNGVIQSWFYGPVGSDNLVEGATSYGGSLLTDSVLADGLIDSNGQEDFVVIAPPATTAMQLADFDFSKPVGPGFEPLSYQNGIAVKQLDEGSSASTLVLDVNVGTEKFELKNLPDIQLRPQFTGSVTSDGPPSAPLPTPSVEQGHPDPTLVTEALEVAATWEKSNPSVPAHPVVVWGGNDAAGTHLVVLRIKTGVVDLVILEWSGDAPGLHGEVLMHASAPDEPIAFAYRALDGTRIGVIGSRGATRAVLDFGGKVSSSVALDPTGFASFRVTNPSPPPSNDAASDLEIVAQVRLFDAGGHLLESVPEPPSV